VLLNKLADRTFWQLALDVEPGKSKCVTVSVL